MLFSGNINRAASSVREKKGIHLVSDEIYALSVYERDDRPSEAFTSVRSIDCTGIISSDQVHVLYGMSKVVQISRYTESERRQC